MDKCRKNQDIETDDVEADCGPIERVHPFHDFSSEVQSKDIYKSVDSGYGSVNSTLSSGITSDFEKLKLNSIEEGPSTGELYDKVDEKRKETAEESDFIVLDHEELLFEIFKPDKDGDS